MLQMVNISNISSVHYPLVFVKLLGWIGILLGYFHVGGKFYNPHFNISYSMIYKQNDQFSQKVTNNN